MDTIPQALERLKALRIKVADWQQEIAHRELDARVLRGQLEAELVIRGESKTQAEKLAKCVPKYIDHERVTIALIRQRDEAQAEAEGLRLWVDAVLANKTSVYADHSSDDTK